MSKKDTSVDREVHTTAGQEASATFCYMVGEGWWTTEPKRRIRVRSFPPIRKERGWMGHPAIKNQELAFTER
ncbi:MAG: hypothetical protein WAN35_17140 [Terracidiphilus sp.]